jgi:hypothetical protein
MRRTFALLTAAIILLLAAKPTAAAPKVPAVGDQLSLSLTNKYGDVLANPTVAQILGDGLVLQRGTMAMKVKYEDLPPDISKKYQSLAAGIIKKEETQGAATAAYVAYTQQLQAEQARQLAAQQAQENDQAKEEQAKSQSTGAPKYLSIAIPNQNWKIVIADLGFGNWQKQEGNNQFVLHGQTGPGGFRLVLLVEGSVNNLPGNDPVYNFYWSNMAHDSLIDAQSVKVGRTDKFIKVAYSAQGQPNVNYFFAYQGEWVDVHLAKGAVELGDDKLFAEFESALSCGE